VVPEETAPQTEPQPELRDYLRVLRRRKFTVILCTVLVVGVALTASLLQTPVYRSAAEIVLQSRTTEALFDSNGAQVAGNTSEAVQTQIRILEGKLVRDEVTKKLGTAPDVSASQVGQTSVLQVKAESTVSAQAAAVANAYANAYIELRRARAVDELLAASQQIQGKIGDLQKQIDDLDNQVSSAAGPQQAAVRQTIAPQKDALVEQQALFKQKIDQLQVDAALKNGGAELVTPASASSAPVRPTPRRTGILALVVGLMLGVGVAFLLEYLDDSIKTKEDLERSSAGLPVLGLIPLVKDWKDQEETHIISVEDPRSPPAEAYRTLRTSLQFLALDQPMRTLQITSAGAREGKTTTLVNLGVALAGSGLRVVLVDCDLRRPRLHEFFGLESTIGFTSVLLGKVPLSSALQQTRGIERLSILGSGPLPPNPSELLSSRRTAEVLTSLQPAADIVLVDSPPVLPVTDPLVLSGRVDATLLITVAGATTRKEVSRAIELLRRVDAPLVGTVLNSVSAASSDDYGYSYKYYGSRSPERRREAAKR